MVYVDDLLAIRMEPKTIMDSFSMYYLKDTVIYQDLYLGANVGKWQFSDVSNFWWMNDRDYTVKAINLSQKFMEQNRKVFMYGKQAKRPMITRYRTELDVSPVLNSKEA